MKRKRILALLLSAAMVVTAFAGCGSEKEESSSAAASSAASQAEESGAGETSETTETGEPEELTLPLSEDGAGLDVYITYSGTIVSDINSIALPHPPVHAQLHGLSGVQRGGPPGGHRRLRRDAGGQVRHRPGLHR